MPSHIGQTLCKRYQVLELIGRGGMAEVYKVWDQERSVHLAMKVLHEDLAIDRVFVRRFKREAQTLAKLQHPNIVRFYGFEQDGDLAFMLLDHVEGRSLKRLIFDHDGPLPLDSILNISQQVLSALGYAHRQGFVHADIKPGNILIDAQGRAHVSDFGIARMTDAATMTMAGAGTPAYMAPETIRGEAPAPAVDIYGWGVVLFEMLTGGERPFTGERATVEGSTGTKVRWEQLNLEPPSMQKWNPTLTPEMEAVVLRCLAKEPEGRYASMLDLLRAQEGAIGGIRADEPEIIAEHAEEAGAVLEAEPAVVRPGSGRWGVITGVALLAAVAVLVIGNGLARREREVETVETEMAFPTENLLETIVVTASPMVVPITLPSPTFTSTLSPRMYDFSACLQPCDGSNRSESFDEGTTRIYIQWSYENIPNGAHYERVWRMNGNEWIRYSCVWTGESHGTDAVELTEPYGLHSGTWEMTIYVNGSALIREEIELEGNHDYWDPAGTVNRCYGLVD